MRLREFYRRLEAHDWWHRMSDSHSVYQRGEQDLRELKVISRESRKHDSLFKRFEGHVREGKRKPRLPPL